MKWVVRQLPQTKGSSEVYRESDRSIQRILCLLQEGLASAVFPGLLTSRATVHLILFHAQAENLHL